MKTAQPTATINTALPSNLDQRALLSVIHNHEIYIKTTCPQLISYELKSGDPRSLGQPVVYSVTDKKPMGQTTYTLTLVNQPDGIDTLVNAKPPVGTLTITGKWRIEGGELKEEVVIDANVILKKMVKGNVEKGHADQHKELMKLAAAY